MGWGWAGKGFVLFCWTGNKGIRVRKEREDGGGTGGVWEPGPRR